MMRTGVLYLEGLQLNLGNLHGCLGSGDFHLSYIMVPGLSALFNINTRREAKEMSNYIHSHSF